MLRAGGPRCRTRPPRAGSTGAASQPGRGVRGPPELQMVIEHTQRTRSGCDASTGRHESRCREHGDEGSCTASPRKRAPRGGLQVHTRQKRRWLGASRTLAFQTFWDGPGHPANLTSAGASPHGGCDGNGLRTRSHSSPAARSDATPGRAPRPRTPPLRHCCCPSSWPRCSASKQLTCTPNTRG